MNYLGWVISANLVLVGNNLFCFQILRPFRSTCVRYNDPTVNGFDKSNAVEVYSGPLSVQIRAVKLFSLLTSTGGFVAQPVVLQKASELGTHMAIVVAVSSFIGFFTIVTPVLLHLITKKYVRKIHFDPKTELYEAMTYTFFLRDKVVCMKYFLLVILSYSRVLLIQT